jgi:hypothetical protein
VLVAKVRTLKGKAFVAYVFDLTYGSLSEWQSWSERDDNAKLDELLQMYEVDVDAVVAKLKLERPELYPADKPKPAKAAKKTPAKKVAKGKKAPAAKLSPEARQRIADAIKKRWSANKSKPTGKSAAANDVDDLDDEDLDKIATALADTADEKLQDEEDDGDFDDDNEDLEADEPDEEDED